MNQHGYSLLLSLFAVTGVGAVWLAGMAVQNTTATEDQTLELSRAKTALISYAVNYIDHYGAQGAGIGHLPCPDTDKPDNTQADAWHRDGPNPPCAKKTVEQGWLPRHVNVRDGRYHFHTRARQRLLYAVSGQYVNNPLGRVVNPITSGDIRFGLFDDVIAVIATPPLDMNLVDEKFWLNPEIMRDSGAAFTLIRTRDIREQSMQRVGGWLVGALNEAGAERCVAADVEDPCQFSKHKLEQCNLDNRSFLLHWLNPQSEIVNCEDYAEHLGSTFTVLEDVPIKRHWIMRNKWFDFVELLFDKDCMQETSSECRFVLQPMQADESVLPLKLQPI